MLEIIGAIDVPYKWALIAREPLEHWSVGRISLLGDACHPLLPFLGQGANMAIEDGMVLARCLTEYEDVVEALTRYEVARLNRTAQIGRASLASISHMHNPELKDPIKAQTFMARESTAGAWSNWIYEYDAATAAI